MPATRSVGVVNRLWCTTRKLIWLVVLSLITSGAQASLLGFCDAPSEISAQQKDRLLRFGAVIREVLESSGASVALISRSGLNLSRYGVRYSHAGISLKANPANTWAVRQLYFACDEGRPRIFDQGLAAFLLGLSEPSLGYVSVVLLPEGHAAPVASTVLDARVALSQLNDHYSANAYPFSDQFQNCNQWVAEMLAHAWGNLAPNGAPRSVAQGWLRDHGYRPTEFHLQFPSPALLAATVSWIRLEDHPVANLRNNRLQVSLPASIEHFIRIKAPRAQRFEFCHNGRQVVVRRGWQPIADGCVPDTADEVRVFD